MTSMSLLSCLVTCSTTVSSPATTMVIREMFSFSVTPTVRLSMLYPRLLKRPAVLASTPGLFWTRTDRVCLIWLHLPALRVEYFVKRRPCRHHGEHALFRFDSEVNDLSLIHISEPTRLGMISYAVFCLK